MTKIQINKFSNGLRIGVDEMESVETVSIGVFVNTGSRNEDLSINGISHFLEHLAFKGTPQRAAKKIAEDFESIGGYINAFTSREKTVYYVKVLKEYTEFAIEFLADILQNSLFDKTEIKKESGVILQEYAMTHDTPDDIIFDYFQETAFPKQPIGMPIIGSKDNIKSFNRDDFIDYINQQYGYKNIVIAGSGNIKIDELSKWVKKYFTKLSNKKIAPVKKAIYKGGYFKKEKKLEQINYVVGFKGVSYYDDDYYKSQILSMILGGGMSSRLFQEVRENKGLAYSIYSFTSSYKDSGIFGIYCGTTPDKCQKMINILSNEIKKICEKINENELVKVKTQFKASLKMAKESTSSRMKRLGSDILLFDKINTDDEIISKFQNISRGDIRELAEKIFSTKSTVAMIGNVKNVKEITKFI